MFSYVFSTPEYTPTWLSSESYSTHPVLAIGRAKSIRLAMEIKKKKKKTQYKSKGIEQPS